MALDDRDRISERDVAQAFEDLKQRSIPQRS